MYALALVGRAAERAAIDRLLADARAGRGGSLLVTGEAGIGKSRLVEEAHRAAVAADMTVLTGRAVEGGGTYRPLAEALLSHVRDADVLDADELRPYRRALRRIIPELHHGSGDEAVEGRGLDPVVVLGEGIVRLLRHIAGTGGCVLLREDLHWADADSIAVLGYLAGAVGSAPVAIVASARDEPAHPAAEPLRDSPLMTVAALSRLDDEQVTALAATIRRRAPLSDEQLRLVIERSDGLPLLVEELLSGMAIGGGAPGVLPPSLAALVGRRLSTLGPDHAEVIRTAAVLGDVSDLHALGAVTGRDERTVLAALRAAVAEQLLVVDRNGALVWRHALTRDAVLATLLPPEHATIADRGATVLLDRGEPGDDARAAELLDRAGHSQRAATVLLALARRDVARGALRSAEERLGRAAALSPHNASVLIERTRLLSLRGRAAEALAFAGGAVDDLAGDDHAQLRLELARAAILTSDWAVAEEHVRRAGRPDDPRSLVLAADAAFGDHRPAESARLAKRAVQLAEHGDPRVLCEALIVTARAVWTDLDTAAAVLTRAAAVATEHGLTPWRIEALRVLGLVQLQTSTPAPAFIEARALAADAGMLATTIMIDLVLADERCTIDGPRAALPAAIDAAARVLPLGLSDFYATVRMQVALFQTLAGDIDSARSTIAAVMAEPDTSPDAVAALTAVSGLPLLLAHDLAGADAAIDRGVAALIRRPSMAPFSLFGIWALLRAVVDPDAQARDQLRTALPGTRPINAGAVDYADAVALGHAGQRRDAAALLARADERLDAWPWWRRLLHTLVLDAAIRDGWGDPVPLLRADLASHEASGDRALAQICHALLRRAGAPTRRGRGDAQVPPPLRALGVTSREVDVLRLVVDGLTNAQIADRLVLSPRTVETHVAHLLAKTRSARRAELRSWTRHLTP